MKPQAEPVTFNRDTLHEFRAVMDKAIADGLELFEYRERMYSVRYAHYLVQYVGAKLGFRAGDAA